MLICFFDSYESNGLTAAGAARFADAVTSNPTIRLLKYSAFVRSMLTLHLAWRAIALGLRGQLCCAMLCVTAPVYSPSGTCSCTSLQAQIFNHIGSLEDCLIGNEGAKAVGEMLKTNFSIVELQ